MGVDLKHAGCKVFGPTPGYLDVVCGGLPGIVGLTEGRDLCLFVLKSNQTSILNPSLQHPGHCPSQQHKMLSPGQLEQVHANQGSLESLFMRHWFQAGPYPCELPNPAMS